MKLSARLNAIAGFIEKDASVADIGTDHCLLPVFLAINGLAKHIIASDISEGSLRSARRTAEKYGVEDKITFVLAPGLSGVCEMQIDTVVISGVGGETIIGILAQADWLKTCGVRLILQPQSKDQQLRLWLHENGYAIQDTKLVLDKRRYYTVLLVSYVL